jgi:hypothetical protein
VILNRTLAVVLAASCVASCAGYKRMTLRATPPAVAAAPVQIEIGDVVRLTLADRRVTAFRVAAIEPDALVGTDGQRVAYADIVVLERRTISKTKTTILLLSPLIALGALMVVIYVGCSIGNCR